MMTRALLTFPATNFCRLVLALVVVIFLGTAHATLAATLSVVPATGVHGTGSTFTVTVRVNTTGSAINAADGTITFKPSELQVVAVNRASSVFNLWTAEPTFSNAAGTISFSGGSPTGYTGANGSIMTITFRAVGSGPARVAITGGSVLAADGRGTNVLTAMNGGTYTLSAATTQPAPEVVVEYVAPANTPAAPQITSPTHPDSSAWYRTSNAELNWTLPAGVTAVRTLLDDRATSVPTRLYENPIRTITLEDLPDGVSYFHLQFQNEEGWGRVAHYRLAVDRTAPEGFVVSLPAEADMTNPVQDVLVSFATTTPGAPVVLYRVRVDAEEPVEITATEGLERITLPAVQPGYRTVTIEAVDAAGNSSTQILSFTIDSFAAPVFETVPDTITQGVVPVFRGMTRPNASIIAVLTRAGFESVTIPATSDDSGAFSIIPAGPLTAGVYIMTAQATAHDGGISEQSPEIRFVVEEPGYLAVGSFVINVLSMLVTLGALAFVAGLGLWYIYRYAARLRRSVAKETHEVEAVLGKQFTALKQTLAVESEALAEARRGKKLTKGEADLVQRMFDTISEAEVTIVKEVTDVVNLVDKQ